MLVQRGTLKTGDILVAGSEFGRVRLLINDRGETIVFYKSLQTERWWMQLPTGMDVYPYLPHIIPCSRYDYHETLAGGAPMRWIKACARLV